MVKKGTVKNVQNNGTWEGKYGLMYKFEVTIGEDTGECLSKTEKCKFEVGKEVEYEFIGGQYPKIKPVSNYEQGSYKPQAKNDSVQEFIIKQNALTNATNFVCNNGGTTDDILDIAEIFSKWVLTGEKTTASITDEMPF